MYGRLRGKLINEFAENEWVCSLILLIIKVMLASVDTTLTIQFNFNIKYFFSKKIRKYK